MTTMTTTWVSGKGDPLAKIARPPVQRWAASAVHSALRADHYSADYSDADYSNADHFNGSTAHSALQADHYHDYYDHFFIIITT